MAVMRDGALGLVYPKFVYPVFIIGLLLSLYLLLLRTRGRSLNVFLLGIILVLSLYGFKNQLYGIQWGISTNYRWLFTPISFILALGPLSYFYVMSVLSSSFRWRKRYWLHFVPSAFFFLLYLTALIKPVDYDPAFMASYYEVSFSHFEQVLLIISGGVYLAFGFRHLSRWGRQQVNHVKVQSWIRRFLILMSSLFIIWAALIFLNYWLYDFGVATLTYNPLWLYMCALLLWLGGEIAADPRFFLVNKGINAGNGLRQITDEDAQQYEERLERLMKEEKLYQDENLSLEKLSSTLGTNPRYLSAFLNSALGKSFYDYVNYYRVEEVKVLLKDPVSKQLTIEAVANRAGFKSKSSFNAAFKKYTQMTPREYMKAS